ncbi:MAG TPA: energy transducer TonB [Chitinophagales bacterium]|nr:energy transducer TonB [Chitinophagales bacterium]
MKKSLLVATVFLLLSGCNYQTEESAGGHVAVQEQLAQTMLQTFNQDPKAPKYYIQVEPKDNDVPVKQSKAILGLLAGMQAQPQHFTIKPVEVNELQGEYGTRVSVSPNSFTFKDGREVNTDIDIELKECYTTGEMLEENLTTTFGNQAMESKVAVYVSATCNGEEVLLKEGEEINIDFPFTLSEGDGYNFYYGTPLNNYMNWLPAGEIEEPGKPAKTQVAKPEFSYKGYNLGNYLLAQLEYPEDAKRNELSSNVEVTFTVDKSGKVRDVNCGSAYKTFRDEIITTLEAMPKWKPATYGKRKINALVKLNVDFNLRRKKQVIVDFSDNNVIAIVNDKTDSKNGSRTCSRQFDKLGWIACNRLVETSGSKADVVIRDDADSDVRIVLKDKNTIVRGDNCVGYSRFDDLKAGQQVYVVAVRYNKGEMYYALHAVTLDKQTVLSLNWIKTTEDEFEEAVRNMNPQV